MKVLSIAAVLALMAFPAYAQQARVVSACGSTAPFGPLTANSSVFLAVDTNGTLCTNATGSSGGAVTIVDGGDVTLGSKADAAAIGPPSTLMSVMRQVDADIKGPISVGTAIIGYTSADFCTQGVAKKSATFAITSATQTSLVAAVAAQKIYICSFAMITGLANNVNFYDVASAGACSAAATDAVMGPASNAATNGFNFAANGGLTLGSGAAMVAYTPTANATLCVVTSSAGPLSGNLTYVQQ